MGPRSPHSTVLTPVEEAMIVEFRRRTLLPLDDVLGCLRISKFTYVEFHEQATRMIGAAFLRSVVVVFPYKIHTVLTDNGVAFADLPQNRSGPTARWNVHVFDRACRDHGIEHRLTKKRTKMRHFPGSSANC